MSKSIDIDFSPLSQQEPNKINQMDSEFDQHLASMKKYILELKEKKTKQLCALWIKKFCEISDSGDLNLKNIRNMYSAKLLNILENCDCLQYPFNERPPTETLRPFEELEIKSARSHIDTSRSANYNSLHTDTATHKNLSTFRQDMDIYSLKHDYNQEIDQFASTFNQNSYLSRVQDDRSHKSNFEYQLRLLEAKFKEEKCNLQQMHSTEIQKILDRKNNELESIKSSFCKKKKDYEDNIYSLEKKIQSLQKELGLQREENESRLNEVRNRTETTCEKRLMDTEKKFNDMISKYEKDKFEMQVQHAKAFQDLVDETNTRLKRVEQEYNDQQNVNDKIIMELENRTNLLKNEMEKNIVLTKSLETDNREKKSQIESLERRVKEENRKNIDLEHCMHRIKETHRKEIGTLNSKMETSLAEKTKEADMLRKRLQNLRDDLSNVKSEADKKCENLSQSIKDKDAQLATAMNTIKQQKIQAETALNELKKDIEANSNRLYEEMREQIAKCENDLVKSKLSKDKQSKEFNKQIEELKNEQAKQIDTLVRQFEEEKKKLKKDHEYEIEKIVKNQDNFCNQIQQSFQHQILDNNQGYNQKIEELNKTINELENKVINLEQELVDANCLRKHQIAELGLLREDEKNKLNRNYENEIDNLKIKIDQDELLYKKRIKEIEESCEIEIQRLQKQSDERIRKLSGTIEELEESLEKIRLENRKLKDTLDREKNDSFVRIEEEKNSVKKYCQNQIANLEKELHQEVIRYKNAEKKLKQLSIEQDQYVTKLKMQYEEKLKGLMPIEVKKDYEETISALKNQIESLQQRAIVLQSELDERNHLVNSSDTASI